MTIRSPICSVLGHVDHGKSSILDKIRGSTIISREAGGITQAIGASIIPIENIKKVCGDMLKAANLNFTIPGLLFLDTPGHAAFTSLRKRGGSLADIAVVVIDINEGFKPQTIESIKILKANKTPFVIAANKVDLIPNWREKPGMILQKIQAQEPDVITKVEERIYQIVGKIHEEFGMQSERFDRVDDYTKQIAIVPCSAKTGEGISALLMVLAGLAQRFLEQTLNINVEGMAKGTILEVKEEKGLGKTMDVIIYDGTLKTNDTIIIGHIDGPIVTKIRGMFEPAPLSEMRDKKSKFAAVKEVHAAIGVKITTPDMEKVMSGMPIRACDKKDVEKVKQEIMQEIDDVLIETEDKGVIIKADCIGSLEAMIKLFGEKSIQIRKASLGEISRKDIIDAESNYETDPLFSVILAFNLHPTEEMKTMSSKVHIISSDIIYKIIDEYEEWKGTKSKSIEAKELDNIVRPCKLQFLNGYVFRQNNPAVVGCEVLNGTAKSGMPIMNIDGKFLTTIKSMQAENESVKIAKRGKQVAVSMEGITVGRQIKEGDIFYSAIPEADFRKLKELKKYLTPDEVEAVKEIAEIMRRNNTVWGI